MKPSFLLVLDWEKWLITRIHDHWSMNLIDQEVFEKRFIDETLFQFRDKPFEFCRSELEASSKNQIL